MHLIAAHDASRCPGVNLIPKLKGVCDIVGHSCGVLKKSKFGTSRNHFVESLFIGSTPYLQVNKALPIDPTIRFRNQNQGTLFKGLKTVWVLTCQIICRIKDD